MPCTHHSSPSSWSCRSSFLQWTITCRRSVGDMNVTVSLRWRRGIHHEHTNKCFHLKIEIFVLCFIFLYDIYSYILKLKYIWCCSHCFCAHLSCIILRHTIWSQLIYTCLTSHTYSGVVTLPSLSNHCICLLSAFNKPFRLMINGAFQLLLNMLSKMKWQSSSKLSHFSIILYTLSQLWRKAIFLQTMAYLRDDSQSFEGHAMTVRFV